MRSRKDIQTQQAWFPWLCAERMNAFGEGVAGRNGPQRRVPEDGGFLAGCRLGGEPSPLSGSALGMSVECVAE